MNKQKQAWLRAQEIKKTKSVKLQPRKRTDEIFVDAMYDEYDRLRNMYNDLNNTNFENVPFYKLRELQDY